MPDGTVSLEYNVISQLLTHHGTPVFLIPEETHRLINRLERDPNAGEVVTQLFDPVNAYHCIRVFDIGICALHRFMFTTGLIIDLTGSGNKKGRYCFNNMRYAYEFMIHWDGVSVPTEADGLSADKTVNMPVQSLRG